MPSRIAPLALAALMAAVVPIAAQRTKPKPQKKPAPKTAPAAPPVKAPEPPPADLVLTVKYTTGNKTTTSSVLLHGARERIEYGNDLVSLHQCDQARTVQLNTKTRTHLASPFDAASHPAQPPASGKIKGGKITYTTTIADGNETKSLFGFTAYRRKTVIVKEASADACDKRPEKIETDGWYIDLPPTTTCTGAPPPAVEIRIDPKDASCRDEVTYVRPAAVGYPLAYSMTATSGTEPPANTTMEVTELKRTTADAQQFDVPDDSLAVKTLAQLTADHRPGEDGPKKPGAIRIGVAPFANKSGQPIATAELAQALAESLGEVEPDIVVLKSDTPDAMAAEATARNCDYIIENTVAELKRPGKGVMGKLSGTNGDALAATVDFALAVPGQPKPIYSGTEKSGGSVLRTAMTAARRVSTFVVPMMMGRFDYVSTFLAMSGSASPGTMQQVPDPVMSSLFSLIDRATGANKMPQTFASEEAAVAAALEKEIEAVSGQLKRRKGSN